MSLSVVVQSMTVKKGVVMKTRIINSEDELTAFAERFRNRGNAVEMDYLKASQVRAFFNKDGNMFAGYVLNLKRPLRYEGWIPQHLRSKIGLFSSTVKVCELTCIWIAGREGRVSSEIIYLYSVIDALLSGAQYTLGGTLSAVVFGIQTQSLPQILYSGYTEYFGIRQQCWIYGASRWVLLQKLFSVFAVEIFKGGMGKTAYLKRARARARKLKASLAG